jgi:hypothetical protein
MSSPIKLQPFPGLIVSCWFPYDLDISRLGPDLRPVLVVEVRKSGKVVCVYGSAAKSKGTTAENLLQPYQIQVPATNVSGLKEPTRFNFLKSVPLEWTDKWFCPFGGNPTVRMGVLDANEKSTAKVAKQYAADLIASDPTKEWGVRPSPVIIVKQRRAKPPQDTQGPSGE